MGEIPNPGERPKRPERPKRDWLDFATLAAVIATAFAAVWSIHIAVVSAADSGNQMVNAIDSLGKIENDSRKAISQAQDTEMTTVKPLPIILVYGNTCQQCKLGVFIENDGLGPAVIRSLHLYVDGHPLARVGDLTQATRDLTIAVPNGPGSEYNEFPEGYGLKEGAQREIFASGRGDVKDPIKFTHFLRHRLFLIADVCSVKCDCRKICSPSIPTEKCDNVESRYQNTFNRTSNSFSQRRKSLNAVCPKLQG
jgi:hypothetical protein